MDEKFHGIDWDDDEHWKVVASGATVISNTPQQLWEQAIKYFTWCKEHPIKSKRTLTSGKTQGASVTDEKVRPYTIKGFCIHAGISERYIKDITDSQAKNSEWYMVVEKILYIIYTQVLEGALVDQFNPIMASKMLNLDGKPEESNSTVKIEITNSQSNELSNSENEVLKKLDFEKVESLKEKLEKPSGTIT